MQVTAIPHIHYATGVNVVFGEEEFVAMVVSGNQMFRFAFTPKHAKRVMLLMQKIVAEYEKKFGELETKLPDVKGSTAEKKVGFQG